MAWLAGLIQLCKVFGFFANLYTEKNKKKAEEKAELGKEMVDAFKQTNKHRRASHINAVIGKLRT